MAKKMVELKLYFYKMDEKTVLNFFKKINLSERYINLCNKFSDYENSKTPKKNEILKILNEKNLNLKFSRQESLFYQDIKIKNYNFRFLLNYKYGLISSLYMLSSEKKLIVRMNLFDASEKLDNTFLDKVEYKCPITTSEIDLEKILEEILGIYLEFKDEFINKKLG